MSSFLGSDDDKIQLNAFDGNGEVLELKKEPANDGGEIKHKEIEKVNQKETNKQKKWKPLIAQEKGPSTHQNYTPKMGFTIFPLLSRQSRSAMI